MKFKCKIRFREKVSFEKQKLEGIIDDYSYIINIDGEDSWIVVNTEKSIDDVKQFLKNWEYKDAFSVNRKNFIFDINSYSIIDHDKENQNNRSLSLVDSMGIQMSIVTSVCHSVFPEPSNDFTVDKTVELLWKRYELFKDGKENLQAMAYFCLDHINNKICPPDTNEKLKKVSKELKINKKLLGKINMFSSTMGNVITARKGKIERDLTGKEKEWLEGSIVLLIKQYSKYIHNRANLKQINMDDLPNLND